MGHQIKFKIHKILALLILIGLTLSGCHRDDEILPVPPSEDAKTPSGAATPRNEQETPTPKPPPTDSSSEVFQPAEFAGMPYRILFPRNYDTKKSYPLHIFLHGIRESGTDNERQLEVGASYYLQDSIRAKYHAFIVFPQCPPSAYWFSPRVTMKLKDLIDTLVNTYSMNTKRISIGGFSMGAYGTFEMAARYPIFEAAVAISGEGNGDEARLMAKAKWRLFAGAKDDVVSFIKTENMYKALKNAGASVSFTLYPEAHHHNAWIKAFSEPDFFQWLFSEHP